MPEMQEDRPTDQRNPALDEFVENVAKVNDGLSGVMAAALRMQMLMLDDARNMMAELNAAAERGDNRSDV
jgi:hypothetical protein